MAGSGFCRVCGVKLPRPTGAYCTEHRPLKDRPKSERDAIKAEREDNIIDVTGYELPPAPEPEPKASPEQVKNVLVFLAGLAVSAVSGLAAGFVVGPLEKVLRADPETTDEDLEKIEAMKAASKMTKDESSQISKFAGGLLAKTSIAESAVVQFMALNPDSLPAMMAAARWASRNWKMRSDIQKLTREIKRANDLEQKRQGGQIRGVA